MPIMQLGTIEFKHKTCNNKLWTKIDDKQWCVHLISFYNWSSYIRLLVDRIWKKQSHNFQTAIHRVGARGWQLVYNILNVYDTKRIKFIKKYLEYYFD